MSSNATTAKRSQLHPNSDEPWGNVEEISAKTGLPPWRIKRLVYAGKIPCSKPFWHARSHARACI